MKEKQIKLNELKGQIAIFKKHEFIYPKKYSLKFPLLHSCKCCGKKSLSKKISIFDDEPVYICKRCGARHQCKLKKIQFQKMLGIVLLIVFLIATITFWANAATHINSEPKDTESINSYDMLKIQAQAMFDTYNEQGIYISDEATLYMLEADYSSETANYTSSDNRYPHDYKVNEDEKILWLAFECTDEDDVTIICWYPVAMD